MAPGFNTPDPKLLKIFKKRKHLYPQVNSRINLLSKFNTFNNPQNTNNTKNTQSKIHQLLWQIALTDS